MMKTLSPSAARTLENVIRHARWEDKMVKRMGMKWFEIRDVWLIQSYEVDEEMWKDPKVREALIKAILARDRLGVERGD